MAAEKAFHKALFLTSPSYSWSSRCWFKAYWPPKDGAQEQVKARAAQTLVQHSSLAKSYPTICIPCFATPSRDQTVTLRMFLPSRTNCCLTLRESLNYSFVVRVLLTELKRAMRNFSVSYNLRKHSLFLYRFNLVPKFVYLVSVGSPTHPNCQ